MADPNRKINLNLPSDDEDSDEPQLNPLEISLVKEYEEEFGTRFTDQDLVFSEFCKQKPKPPPIVFPFDGFHNNQRGGRGGGRFHRGGHRQNFDNRRNFDHGDRHHQHRFQNHRDYDRHQDKRQRTDTNYQQGGT